MRNKCLLPLTLSLLFLLLPVPVFAQECARTPHEAQQGIRFPSDGFAEVRFELPLRGDDLFVLEHISYGLLFPREAPAPTAQISSKAGVKHFLPPSSPVRGGEGFYFWDARSLRLYSDSDLFVSFSRGGGPLVAGAVSISGYLIEPATCPGLGTSP